MYSTKPKKCGSASVSEAEMQERFVALIHRNPVNRAILDRLPELGVDDAWLVAGCLFGAVWNSLSGRPATENIRDYDIVYFDPDTGYDAEDLVIRRGTELFGDLGVEIEIRNQARVPLWFEERFGAPYPPIFEAKTCIERFVVAGTCCGISSSGEVYAPHGYDDMFGGILRLNPESPTPHQFAYKCGSYLERWSWLRVVEGTV
jgi:hypothetical protein